jgi:hypothetical protein
MSRAPIGLSAWFAGIESSRAIAVGASAAKRDYDLQRHWRYGQLSRRARPGEAILRRVGRRCEWQRLALRISAAGNEPRRGRTAAKQIAQGGDGQGSAPSGPRRWPHVAHTPPQAIVCYEVGLEGQVSGVARPCLPKNLNLPQNPICEPAGNVAFSLAQKYIVSASKSCDSG